MGKRSRRERREGQIARAVEAFDMGALRALAGKNPELAAQHVARALAAPPEGADLAELDRLAESLAGHLRVEAGKPLAALALAAAGKRRTPGLRLEEGLAAFAIGRDEIAAEIASGDGAVAAVLGPVLAAVTGKETPAPRGVAAREVRPPVRALHAAARAVAAAVQGAPDRARATLRRIDPPSQPGVLAAEMGLAVDVTDVVHPSRAVDAAERLAASRLVAEHEALRRAFVGEAAAHPDREMVEALVERLPHHAAEIRRAGAGAVAGGLVGAEPGAAATFVRRVGPEAFPEPERARAFLYKGFAALGDDAREAAGAFDRAIALGGDLVEALRGKLINARHVAGEARPDTPEQARALCEMGSAADRLARALAHDPAAAALAAAAEAEAASAWMMGGDDRAALASIERARRLATGSLRERLDEIEIEAVRQREPARAAKMAEALTAARPGSVSAWRLRIDIARRRGDEEERQSLVVEAAAATRDPTLVARAREIRAALGQIAPFEGFVAGVATAGALAVELSRAASKDRDLWEMVRPFRDALAPEARLALDAAVLAIAADVYKPDPKKLHHQIEAALRAWQNDVDALRKLASVAAVAGLSGDVAKAARSMEDDARALVALVEGLASYDEAQDALKILNRAAAALTRSELTRLRAFVRRGGDDATAAEDVVRALDRLLAPGFSLAEHTEMEEDEDDDTLGLPPDQVLGVLMRMMGAGGDPLAKLPPNERRRVEQQLLEIVRRGPSDANMDAVARILVEIGAIARIPFEPPRRRR